MTIPPPASSDPTPDALLVLGRCLVTADDGATFSQMKGALDDARPKGGDPASVELVDRIVADLVRVGAIEMVGRSRAIVTEAGRRALSERTRVAPELLPARWPALRDGPLLVPALDLPAPTAKQLAALRKPDFVRAAVVRRAHRLNLPPYCSGKDAVTALCWQRLAALMDADLEPWTARGVGGGALLTCLLGHELGLRDTVTANKLLSLLAADAAGTVGAQIADLRRAVLDAWRRAADGTASADAAPALPVTSEATADDLERLLAATPIEAFAARLRDLDVERRGDGAVFVATLWDALRGERADDAAAFERFKRRLLQASRSRLLRLSRCDLLDRYDRTVTGRSRIEDHGATFHFAHL